MTNSSNSPFIRSVALGVLLVATSTGANALTVTRCNVLDGGVYKPVLVVNDNGSSTVHNIGEDGLSRQILFDEKAALAWALQKYGADAATSSYGGNCNAAALNDSAAPIAPDDDYGGYDDDDDGGYDPV